MILKTMDAILLRLGLAALLSLSLTRALDAQELQVTLGGPAENLINEEVCFNVSLENSGEVGYQPYLRVFLPPQFTAATFSAKFMGQSLSTVVNAGTFGGGTLVDGNLPVGDPNRNVSGASGETLLLVNLPVGALVADGITLNVEFCAVLGGASATVGTPVEVEVAPVFRYGDTATGDNGSILGAAASTSVTPTLYRAAIVADPSDLVGGPCVGTQVDIVVDVATQRLVTGLQIQAQMPANFHYVTLLANTPGCVVQQQPTVGNGGTFAMLCNNVMGTSATADVTASFMAYPANGLPLTSCDSLVIETPMTVVSNQVALQSMVQRTKAYHMTFEPLAPSEDPLPGSTVSLGVQFGVSAYVPGIEALAFDLLVPDGLSYAGNALLNGVPVSATSELGLGNGTTQLIFDVHAIQGFDFSPCSGGWLTFDANISTNYANGDLVAAGDQLIAEGQVSYTLTGNAAPCVRPIAVGYSIPAVETAKEVISSPANGTNYVPGELVTYRLTMTVDAGNASNVIIEDFFPIPIHQVGDLSLVFGEDIELATIDNSGATPLSISVDEDRNRLVIAWGDLSSPAVGVPLVLAVDIHIPVVAEPFAPGLQHTNFARFTSSNAAANSVSSLTYTTIQVGAPKLVMFKGVLTSDQPAATYSPIQIPVNANANNIDAYDWVTFRTTLTNDGDAPAYDAILTYFPPVNRLNNCELLSVKNAVGTSMAYTGNLFTTGLVIQEIPKFQAGNTVNRAQVEYRCRVMSSAEARENIVNTAQVSYVSVPGGSDFFTPLENSCTISIARPAIQVNVIDVQPGYAPVGQVHVGELVTLEVLLRVPEGITRTSTLEYTLPEGMAVEAFVSLEAPIGVSYGNGAPSQIINGLTITDVGVGVQNQRRRFTMPFGNITNTNSNNLVHEYVRVVFTATVLNTAVNQNGYVLTSDARMRYLNPISGAFVNETTAPQLTVVEAELFTDVSFFESALLPSGQTFVTVTVGHELGSTATAFNVDLLNDLPLGLQLVPNSFITECDDLYAMFPQNSFGAIEARWDSIPLGVTCEFVYVVQVVDAFPPCTQVNNCALIDYTSIFTADLATLGVVPANPLGVRRTGDTANVGGVLNDYARTACGTVEVIAANLNTPQISGPTEVCAGSAINLNIQSYSGAFVEYVWTKDGEPLANNSNELQVTSASANTAGSYAVSVQIGACETAPSQVFDLVVHANPVVALQDLIFPCASGFEAAELTANVSNGSGAYTYNWTGPNYISSDAVAVIANASATNTGVYTLVVGDSNGCTSAPASALVTITAAPALPVIQSGAAVCEGSSFTLNTAVYAGAQSYHWLTPNGEVITAAPFLTNPSAGTADAGEYSVWVQLQNCSTEPSFEVSVAVTENPAAPVFTANATSLCAGETLTLSTTVVAGGYTWSGPNGYVASTATPPAVEAVNILASGSYQLVVNNGACLSAPYSVDVVVHALPAAPAVSSNSPICAGDALEITSVTAANAYSLVFPNSTTDVSSTGAWVINNANASTSGVYTVSVFDGFCWSAPSAPLTIQVDVVPAEQAYAGAHVTACLDGFAVVEAVNDPSLQGSWSAPNNDLTFGSPNSSVSTVSGMVAGETSLATWSLWNAGCGVYSSDEVVVYAPLLPEAYEDYFELIEGEGAPLNVVANDEPGPVAYNLQIITPPTFGEAQVVEGQNIRYIPDATFSGTDELVYRICLTACPDMCDTAIVKLRVFPFLRIPDIITPNGDGVNDVWVIEGIDRFESTELFIYNRWGREVYAANNYANDWDALWNGQPLPNGTYFYVLNNRSTGENLGRGYITVHQ